MQKVFMRLIKYEATVRVIWNGNKLKDEKLHLQEMVLAELKHGVILVWLPLTIMNHNGMGRKTRMENGDS